MLATSISAESISNDADTDTEPNVAASDESQRRNLLLITLDTVRADAIGSYGGTAKTPTLDAVAARGVRFERALTPSPLTLPAHTSILTGIDPPQHGVRDNGIEALPADVPTLASILDAAGYQTAAFVSSRVLDQRFGLARGFDEYGDRMAAERVGQYGYPERDAMAVTDDAIRWLAERGVDGPFFLWIHYYDAHAPYSPPTQWRSDSDRGNYYGEIAYVDHEIARLVDAAGTNDTIIGVVGDHGEMFGEHGEEGHGIFLYEASLRVPLLIAGPGVPAGQVVGETVGTVQLASTLLDLLASDHDTDPMQPPLPGLAPAVRNGSTLPIFSEALLPANAYGWSPLQALSEERWRYIAAPRPELYDVQSDSAEANDRAGAEAPIAERMASSLAHRIEAYGSRAGASVDVDGSLDASLRSLGYLSTSGAEASDIDPKDGIQWLAQRDEAKRWMATGDFERAAQILRRIVQLNPQNQTFLGQYARALFGLGRKTEGVEVYRKAVQLNPKLDFLHVNLAQALLEIGETSEAEAEMRLALELNPRSASASLALAELLAKSKRPAEERQVLQRAADAGTDSAGIHLRLGQLTARDRDFDSAEFHLAQSTTLEPRMFLAWLIRGMNAEAAGHLDDAASHYQQSLNLQPRHGTTLFRYGRLRAQQGATEEAQQLLSLALGTQLSPAERAAVENLLRSSAPSGS